jgi:phospholipase C
MKHQALLADFIRRASAVTTVAAMLAGQASVLAGPPNDQRKKSEEAVRQIKYFIVIYQENWSFDSVYGQFPGASGYALGFDTLPQYT